MADPKYPTGMNIHYEIYPSLKKLLISSFSISSHSLHLLFSSGWTVNKNDNEILTHTNSSFSGSWNGHKDPITDTVGKSSGGIRFALHFDCGEGKWDKEAESLSLAQCASNVHWMHFYDTKLFMF